MDAQVITERNLPAFRTTQLAPGNILGRLSGPESLLLFHEPPSIGKTTLGRHMIPAFLRACGEIFATPNRAGNHSRKFSSTSGSTS